MVSRGAKDDRSALLQPLFAFIGMWVYYCPIGPGGSGRAAGYADSVRLLLVGRVAILLACFSGYSCSGLWSALSFLWALLDLQTSIRGQLKCINCRDSNGGPSSRAKAIS